MTVAVGGPSHREERVMLDTNIVNLDTGSTTIGAGEIEALAARLRGTVIEPGDASYDEARAIWNAMIDRRPGLIVRCAGASDVVQAVRFAREHGLLVSVRGGGHNIAGNAVCHGGLLIDLSPMHSVRVDPSIRRAWVEPGALLADLDKETQAFALAVPTGINSTTGVAGLTLGGGFGWLTRKFGLTIDNLISADVVTANGEVLRASLSENPDLFWAIRGGGGNFGIVTAFEFQLHQVGPQVLSGLVVHPFADAGSVLKAYRKALETAPEELTCWVVMRQAPPLPFLPAEWHGKEVVVLAICYCGNLEDGEKATAQLRSIGTPIADVVGPTPFVACASTRSERRSRTSSARRRSSPGSRPSTRFSPPARAITGRATTSPSFRTRRSTFSSTRSGACPAPNAKSFSAMSEAQPAASRPTRRPSRSAARITS
jgi:FAD/FMN-containing dehydrogenase